MNKSDSERVAAVLEQQGYKATDNKNQADLAVINTCGVRQAAEDRVYGLVPRIKKQNPGCKIVLTGCLVNREDVRKRLKNFVDVWLPITKISDFRFKIYDFLHSGEIKNNSDNRLVLNKSKILILPAQTGHKAKIGDGDYLKIKPKYSSNESAFVPIGNGCNNFCSYCVVPHARGREVWRPAGDIIDEVKNLVKNGYKEIILIAQNVNSYQSESVLINANKARNLERLRQINFAKLLRMVNNIEGNFGINFATSHPKDMSDELINTIAKSEKILPQIHLPVQSGDNQILKKMNRRYTVGDYKKLIKKIHAAFKKYRPNVKLEISTDIIVGFPGETKKQFLNTVKLCKEIKFAKAYLARYSPRPGTAAARLKDDVLAEEKKRRWLVLEKLVNKS